MSDKDDVKVDPSGFRKRLREDVAADYDKIRGALLRALDAEKEVSLTCSYCRKSSKVRVPDHTAANKAAELYMNAGFGRPESESRMSPEEEASQKVRALTDERLLELRLRWFRERGWKIEPPDGWDGSGIPADRKVEWYPSQPMGDERDDRV